MLVKNETILHSFNILKQQEGNITFEYLIIHCKVVNYIYKKIIFIYKKSFERNVYVSKT